MKREQREKCNPGCQASSKLRKLNLSVQKTSRDHLRTVQKRDIQIEILRNDKFVLKESLLQRLEEVNTQKGLVQRLQQRIQVLEAQDASLVNYKALQKAVTELAEQKATKDEQLSREFITNNNSILQI